MSTQTSHVVAGFLLKGISKSEFLWDIILLSGGFSQAGVGAVPMIHHGFYCADWRGKQFSPADIMEDLNENQVKEQSFQFTSLGRVKSSY